MSIVRPCLTILTEGQKALVHFDSLQILAETGVRVDSRRVRQLFARAGCRVGDDNLVRIPPKLVDWALSTAPSHIDIYDRRGNYAFRLGCGSEGGTRFGIGVTNLYYQDPATDDVVPFTREHMAISTRLGHALPGYDVLSAAGVPQDLSPQVADFYATLELAANTTKPLVILVAHEPSFPRVLDLLEHLCGDLASRPFAIPYVNPITPLVINEGTSDKMLVALERGLPVIYSSYGMAGATTPITATGTLALLNAELLAGLVLTQLIRLGAPVILGSLPASFDMRAMIGFYGPQTMLLNLACAEMMAYYRLPHCGTSGSGAGWGPDLLAADLLWMNHLTSCTGAAGLAPFVGGNFDSLAFSPTTVVYAHEVICQARAFAQGFALDEDSVALDEIARVGPGGSFLTAGLTLKGFRAGRAGTADGHIYPRLSLEAWQAAGCPQSVGLLRQYTMELTGRCRPPEDYTEMTAQGEAIIGRLTVDG